MESVQRDQAQAGGGSRHPRRPDTFHSGSQDREKAQSHDRGDERGKDTCPLRFY